MRFVALGAAALLLIGSSSVALTKAQEQVTFMALDVVNFRPMLEQFISEFEKENPDVDVVPNFTPDLFNQFLPLLQSNKLSDITFISSSAFVPYMASGRLNPVPKEYVDKIEGSLNKAALAAVTRGDDVYAVPYNYYPSSGVVMYNEKIWQDAGLDPSTAKTWDDFMGLAEKVTKRDANGKMTLAGFSAQRDSFAIYLAWLMQLGGKPFNDDGTAAFNSPEGKAALQQYADVYQKWKTDDYEFGDTVTVFNQGLVGSTMVGPWYESILAAEHPDIKIGHVIQPPLAGVKPGQPNYWPVIETWSQLVSAEGAKKDGTWRFIDFLLRPDIAARWSKASGEMTTVTAALSQPEVMNTSYIEPYTPALGFGVSQHVTEYLSNDVIEEFHKMLESVGRGQATIDDALANCEAEINRLTARMAPK